MKSNLHANSEKRKARTQASIYLSTVNQEKTIARAKIEENHSKCINLTQVSVLS